MNNCEHSWRLGNSRQFAWQVDIYGDKKTIFGNPKRDYKQHMCGLISQFYCSKCLTTKIKKREHSGYGPEWWVEGIETHYSQFGRPSEMWDVT